ncbi:MAG: TolC family protein [Myxococcota bacterium]
MAGITALILSLLLPLTGAPLTGAAAEDPASLVEEALAANPSLESLRGRVAELEALAGVAGLWRDPSIGIQYLNVPVDSFSLNDHPMSGVQLRLQQNIPPRGWSRMRRDVAWSRARTSEYALAEARERLRRDVTVLYWRLTLSRQLEAVTRAHIARTRDLLGAVKARYETGAARQHELLRLRVLEQRLRDELGDFARSDRELSAGLARVLARRAGSSFVTPDEPTLAPVVGDAASWSAQARRARPELQRLAEAARTEERAAELARIEGVPDVDVWIGYRIRQIDTIADDGTDFFTAGLSIPIPWRSAPRSRAESAAHLHAARSRRAELAASLDRLDAELAAIHARWSRAENQARTYHDELTPEARAALESAFAEYRVGRAEFATLYEAEIELLELERTLLRATIETHVQAAEARARIGAPLQGGPR